MCSSNLTTLGWKKWCNHFDGSAEMLTVSTLQDKEKPTFAYCPANFNVTLRNQNINTTVSWGEPIVRDNVPGVSMSSSIPSGAVFGIGLYLCIAGHDVLSVFINIISIIMIVFIIAVTMIMIYYFLIL